MDKCDIVIPIYKSPEWVELCLYALFKNTANNIINKVLLVNDSNDDFTLNCLNNLKNRYGKKIRIIQNDENLGFTKTANIGMKATSSDFVLLLNTDCIISKYTIEKLIKHLKKDPKIGLICPISNNAANLSLDILEGFTYSQMNTLLEDRFSGKIFDACSIVGNCLMITRKCIDKIGFFDEIYSPGYGEETDYQFKAMRNGFSAKVAIDTYVFHKAETSFGISKKKQTMVDQHREIFMSRWSDIYEAELEKYEHNNPIKLILTNFKEDPPQIKNSAMFYLMNIGNGGGVNVIVDIINRLAINNYQCNIIYDAFSDYSEIMLFAPICRKRLDEIQTDKIIATLWITAFIARQIADEKHWKIAYFIQGFEQHFENGKNYGAVEVSYKLSDQNIVVSKPLEVKLRENYKLKTQLIRNGVNIDLIKNSKIEKRPHNILIILRNDYMKSDYVMLDLLRLIDNSLTGVHIRIVSTNRDLILPLLGDKNTYTIIDGPIPHSQILSLLQQSDIYMDATVSEGFGLTALEAIISNCVPIVSNSLGVNDYIIDGVNGLLVNEVNDAQKYFDKLRQLLNNAQLYRKFCAQGQKTAEQYDVNMRIEKYAKALCMQETHNKRQKLSPQEQQIFAKIIEYFTPQEKEETTNPIQSHNRTKGGLFRPTLYKIRHKYKTILNRL